MVCVKVSVNDVVDLVRRGNVGVAGVVRGRQHVADQFVQVAGDIAPVGVGAGSHSGVHQDGLALAHQNQDAVVELQLPVFESVLVRLPSGGGNLGEHGRRGPRWGNHVNNRGQFHIANHCFVCHKLLLNVL